MKNREFHYTYHAPTAEERKEIDSIRRQYAMTEKGAESKLERLRRLDSGVKNTALALSLSVGISACLLFGLGLAMVLEWKLWLGGVLVAALGGAGMGIAPLLHKKLLKRGRKKHGEEILRLSEELLRGEE